MNVVLPQFFFNLDNFSLKNEFIKKVTFKGTHLAFLVVFVVGICSGTRSLAFSGSRSRFWLLLMLQAIHHFRSNFFKRRYGSKNHGSKLHPENFPRQQPTFGSLHSNIIAKLALEMTYVVLPTVRSFKVLRPFCLLKTMNERCYWGVP